MDDRTDASPAHNRHPSTAGAEAPPQAPPTSEADQRPTGALAVTAILVVAILVSWFGMYALNVVRN